MLRTYYNCIFSYCETVILYEERNEKDFSPSISDNDPSFIFVPIPLPLFLLLQGKKWEGLSQSITQRPNVPSCSNSFAFVPPIGNSPGFVPRVGNVTWSSLWTFGEWLLKVQTQEQAIQAPIFITDHWQSVVFCSHASPSCGDGRCTCSSVHVLNMYNLASQFTDAFAHTFKVS